MQLESIVMYSTVSILSIYYTQILSATYPSCMWVTGERISYTRVLDSYHGQSQLVIQIAKDEWNQLDQLAHKII